MASRVQSLLTSISLAADQAEVEALSLQLQEAVDDRLAELAQDDDGKCISCGYTLTLGAQAICLCCAGVCPCGCQWPPYNEFFRCEVQARLSWFGLEATLYQLRPSKLPFEPRRFPGDPAPPSPALAPGASIFERLRQVDLSDYAGRFTRLNPVGPGRWRGKCPLHEEKTGSFYVFQGDRGWRWHCFGACAHGGDIVSLKRELRQLGKV